MNRRNLRRRLLQQRSNGFNLDKNESLGIIKQSFQSVSILMENSTKQSEMTNIKNLNKSNVNLGSLTINNIAVFR